MTVHVALEKQLPADLSGVDRWIYAGEDATWRLVVERDALAAVPRLEIADALQRKARELRRPFLEAIGELGVRNDSVEWWASQLAARTSFTRFYDRVCMLATVLDELASAREKTTLVVCSSSALAAEIARAAGVPAPTPPRTQPPAPGRARRSWVRLAPAPLVPRSLRASRETDPRYRRGVLRRRGLLRPTPFGGPGTVLLFTWIDGRSFRADGGYADPHLGPLAELLRERGLDVAHVARVLPGTPFAGAVDLLKASGERFVFPDAYLELDDHRDCAHRAAAFAPELPEDARAAGVPLRTLALELVDRERSSQAQALLLEPLLRRFAAAGVRPERIVHTCEGHPWELVLGAAARRHLPDALVIGYENLNMSRLALSMYPAACEAGLRPIPHRIVTNGPAFRDVLLEEGAAADAVRAGCGLRHGRLWETPVHEGPAARPLRALAATEITPGPSAELVAKAAAAFAGDPAVELVVKCHPLVSRDAIVSALGPLAGSVRFDERPTLELLQDADVLLYTYTGVAFEALALGVPPLFVRSEQTLDLDQLEFAADLRWQARTPEELRAVAAEIAALPAEALAAWRSQAREAAQRALAPLHAGCVEAFL